MSSNIVVKVGGSFQNAPSTLKGICEILTKFSDENRFLIVPGGGKFADLVHQFQSKYDFSDRAAHRMALLSMDIFGYLLKDLLKGFSSIYNPRESVDGCGVFFPFETIKNCGLEESWQLTSDSISAWLCGRTDFEELVLIKRVDGIYDQEGFRGRISTRELRQMNQTVVDPKLPDILERFKISCYIVNGEYPLRIKRFFEKKRNKCTKIFPEV